MMRKSIGFVLCAVAMVIATHREGRANHLDATVWAMTGTDRVKIGRERTAPQDSAFTLTVDASSHIVLTFADVTFGGAYLDKGKRGFKVVPDEAASEAVTQFLTDELVQTKGATAVEVEKTTIKVTGVLSKDGTTLTARTKASIKGTATINDRRVRGKLTIVGAYSGTKQS